MEGGNKKKSSLASDLFGANDTENSASKGVFGSIFGPPHKVLGRESVHSSEYEKKYANENPAWNAKSGGSGSDANAVGGGSGQNKSVTDKDDNSSYYQQEEKAHPFHYNSSIYYGGQDVYAPPPRNPNPTFTTFKDGKEDDSAGASRGNWWQGSLYY